MPGGEISASAGQSQTSRVSLGLTLLYAKQNILNYSLFHLIPKNSIDLHNHKDTTFTIDIINNSQFIFHSSSGLQKRKIKKEERADIPLIFSSVLLSDISAHS